MGYRKKVVLQNLKNAFPEKGSAQIREIAKNYYRHFSDLFLESFKLHGMSENELADRFRYENIELINELYDAGKNITLITGHYGNWEWLIQMPAHIRHRMNVLYRPIQNEAFDQYINLTRSRYGAVLIPVRETLRVIQSDEKAGRRTLTYFLGDQTPPADSPYWSIFLNQREFDVRNQ